jgi:3-oxoacyl-[acyl-carrier-protein] synthase II
MKRRVVITGIGSISSLGNNIEEMETNLFNGNIKYESVPVERFSTNHKTLSNDKGFVMDQNVFNSALKQDASMMVEVAIKTIEEALKKAKISVAELQSRNAGLCLGTSVGASYAILNRIKKSVENNEEDHHLALYSSPRVIGNIASKFKLKGSVSAISTACASGTNSIGRAFDLVENGKSDLMICGGLDVFTELTYTGFNALMAISKTKCKPFSKSKDGMSLGDASAILILEDLESAIKRKAHIYAEVKGYHILNEAYHPTAPHPDGIYALKCMQKTLEYANMKAENIDYINAHGTGTLKNDGAELKGCESLLVDKRVKTYMGSTKCLTGHTLGAAGSIEAIISILSMKNNMLYANYDEGVEMPTVEKINFVTQNIKNITINNVLSNSFGFGGNMASILLSKYI